MRLVYLNWILVYLNYANVIPKIASISMEHSAITQSNNSAASQIVDNLQLKILTKRPPLFFINFNTDPAPLFSAAVPTHPGMSQVMTHPGQSCNAEELGDEWTIAGLRQKILKEVLKKSRKSIYIYCKESCDLVKNFN